MGDPSAWGTWICGWCCLYGRWECSHAWWCFKHNALYQCQATILHWSNKFLKTQSVLLNKCQGVLYLCNYILYVQLLHFFLGNCFLYFSMIVGARWMSTCSSWVTHNTWDVTYRRHLFIFTFCCFFLGLQDSTWNVLPTCWFSLCYGGQWVNLILGYSVLPHLSICVCSALMWEEIEECILHDI